MPVSLTSSFAEAGAQPFGFVAQGGSCSTAAGALTWQRKFTSSTGIASRCP